MKRPPWIQLSLGNPLPAVPSFLGVLFLLWCIGVIPAVAQDQMPAATLVHFSGQVDVLPGAGGAWRPAAAGVSLSAGDCVRTGPNGRAALLVADETMIRLNRNSLFVLKAVAFKAGWLQKSRPASLGGSGNGSRYELKSGQLWMRNKNKDIRIDIQTPLVVAGIRGTELDIRIGDGGVTVLSVLEGRVLAENTRGTAVVGAMEQVIARVGEVLEKRVLLSPENTVQWVLHLPPVISADWGALVHATGQGAPVRPGSDRLRDAHAALLDNDFSGAETQLAAVTSADPGNPAAWTLYAQSLLVNGNSTRALAAAQRAVAMAPDSVPALLTRSYAHQAVFQLEEALATARRAMNIAPENETVRLAVARLMFALDDTNGAKAQLAGLSKTANAPAWNLRGFIYFADHETIRAVSCFEGALAIDPGMAESYLGLALARMRLGEKPAAVAAITTAMLLEPRRSLFLSYWGKMLYEMGRPQKALDILSQAAELDPADPTPWLYRAHILSDLNQAAAAIAAFNQAIARNGNRAVYRSRFLLDKDLAVKNVSLARLYWKLGMGDWGVLKAWKSVKLDYANSAAHDFWAWAQYYLAGGAGITDTSEWLKSFLFKPANANTFNTFNDYTLFYEQPDVGGTVSLRGGSHELRNGSLNVHGASPRHDVSYQLDLLAYSQDQWRGGLYEEGSMIRPGIKWDLSPRDHLSVRAHLETVTYGDTDTLTQRVPVDPANRSDSDYGQVELGYYRRMTPHADLLIHLRRRFESDHELQRHQRFFFAPDTYDTYTDATLAEPYTLFQAMQIVQAGDHQFLMGTFQYWSDRDYDAVETTFLDFGGGGVPVAASAAGSHRTRRQQSYYLQDIWRLSSRFTFEGAIYADLIENVNSAEDTRWSETYWNHRAGLLFSPTPAHTLSLVYSRHLDPLQGSPRIDPIDIAGQPLASLFEGARLTQWGVGWQYEWPRGCVISRYFELAMDLDVESVASGIPAMVSYENEYQGIEMSFNQLVFDRFGLNLGYILLTVTDDQADPANEGDNQSLYGRLSYLHPRGFYGGLLQQYFAAHFDHRTGDDSNDFNITSVYLGFELPGKRGDFKVEVINLFDRQFDGVYLSDLAHMWPETTVRVQFQLFF